MVPPGFQTMGLPSRQQNRKINVSVTITITYDSSRAITVTCDDHTHYVIKQYSLATSEIMFVEHYRGTYLKMKEIEQNQDGNKYVIPYMDDGVWKLRIFD